ncbi:MAG: TetR/AcrR family transcriptional regulator [Acidimicrobiia bacterium]
MGQGDAAVRPEDERDRILRAARELLAANGYSGLKIPLVGARANVSMRRLYQYFESKLHLLQALYEIEAAGINRRITNAVATAHTPIEQLDVWVVEMVRPAVEPALRARALRFAIVRVEVLAEFGVELWTAATPVPPALTSVIEAGVASGDFHVDDLQSAARAIYALSSGTMYNAFALEPDEAKVALEIARRAVRRIVGVVE